MWPTRESANAPVWSAWSPRSVRSHCPRARASAGSREASRWGGGMLMVILTVAVFVASCSGSNGNAVSPNGDGGRQEGSATVDSSVDVLVDSAGVSEGSAHVDSSGDSRAAVVEDSAGGPQAG